MSTREDLRARPHASGKLEESYDRTSEGDAACIARIMSRSRLVVSKSKYSPIRTPKYAVTICKIETWAISAITLPILVRTAASPTTECSAATV